MVLWRENGLFTKSQRYRMQVQSPFLWCMNSFINDWCWKNQLELQEMFTDFFAYVSQITKFSYHGHFDFTKHEILKLVLIIIVC